MRRLLIALAILLGARAAHAYPHWQLSTGATRCNQCHFAPAGGGLLSDYGRYMAGDELSSFGGDGAFLHGAVQLPSWLSLGGDLRGAVVAHDVQDPSGSTLAAFPMQADFSLRLALPKGISAAGTVGLRGQVRDPDLLVPIQNYQPVSTSQFISREHYLMAQSKESGYYVRAGRFFAPFGLRFAEHIFYVRRDLGFDELEETYNVSAGVVRPAWEVHLTGFAPDFVRDIGSRESGFAGYYERRLLGNTLALAGQTRIASAPGATRYIFGAVAKSYVEPLRTLLFTELDGVTMSFDDRMLSSREQVVGIAGLTVLPLRGVSATLLGERNQVDVSLPTAWTGGSILLDWIPYAHCELQVMGRLQFPSGGDAAKTLFIQLHYFL
jgi:hypothetical protein